MSNPYEIIEEGDFLKLQKVCSVSGDLYIIKIHKDRYKRWTAGTLIQDVLPELSIEQREFLISGTAPAEWNDLFKKVKKNLGKEI